MIYGNAGAGGQGASLPRFVRGETLEFDTAVEETLLALSPGGIYWLVAMSTTKATDAYSGHQTYQLEVPTGTKYGTTAGHFATMFSQGTSRVKLTANSDSTFSITTTGTAYRVKYALYKVA